MAIKEYTKTVTTLPDVTSREISKTTKTKVTVESEDPEKKFSMPFNFMGIPIAVILFIMLIAGGAIIEFNNNIDTFMPTSSVNSSGDTVKLPYRVDELNDQPIAELNGHTLREVFETYTVDVEQITTFGITWSYQDNIIQSNGTSTTNNYLNFTPNMTLGNKVYYNLKYISGSLTGTSYIYNNSVVQLVETNNNYSGFHVIDYSNFRFRISNGTVSDNYSAYLYVTDVDDLGISHITIQKMDYYYDLYVDQQGQTYDNYYYLTMEDYRLLGDSVIYGTIVHGDGSDSQRVGGYVGTMETIQVVSDIMSVVADFIFYIPQLIDSTIDGFNTWADTIREYGYWGGS